MKYTARVQRLVPQVKEAYALPGSTLRGVAKAVGLNLKTVVSILRQEHIVIKDRFINILGDTFGQLTVKRFVEKDTNRKGIWECLCVCGRLHLARGGDLRSGKILSCGCLKAAKLGQASKAYFAKLRKDGKHFHNWQGYEGLSKRYYSQVKRSAFDRRLEFAVDPKLLWELFQQQEGVCSLSGIPIALSSTGSRRQTASLDRIDSSRGYVPNNVQWVHKDINNMKQDFSVETFIAYCKKVVEKCR